MCMRHKKNPDQAARALRFDKVRDLARQIITTDERNTDAWWNLAMAQSWLNDKDSALDSLRVVLKQSPKFAEAWVQYGLILEEKGQSEQALKALSQALQFDPMNDCAREAARICEKQKNFAGQMHYLMRLEAQGNATGSDLNNIGRAYWEKNHFTKAIHYYRRAAAVLKICSNIPLQKAAPYFNLALVYNHNEISQDVDAIDSLERALRIHPEYTRAKDQVAAIEPRLQELVTIVLSHGESGLQKEDWYRFYINPFELLVGIDQGYELESFDAKTIKSLKNKLFQEIELEDGSIHYVDNLSVDKSRALEICGDLNDETFKRYHWLVFKEPHLLSFLSRGDIHHFLCLKDYKPLHLLDEIDNEGSDFKKWLSPIFAKQYELVLTRALKNRCVPLIESLFDGRRWVLAEHEEICFGGAKRQIDSLLDPLRSTAKEAEREAPTVAGLEAVLQGDHLTSIVNLLPEPFRDQQNEAVSLLRSIAIKAFNEHGDADLSQTILTLSRKFNFKSASLKQRLEEDFKQIQKNIAEERKYEVKLTRGEDAWQITKDGVRKGAVFIPADDVSTIRWGILITGSQYSQTYNFLIVSSDNEGNVIKFSWESSKNVEKQKNFFNELVNASLNYIVPNICANISKLLGEGKAVKIGPCSLTIQNLKFEKPGWFSSKQIIIPWSQVETKVQNGTMLVYDKSSPKIQAEMELRTTENAVILPFFAQLFGKK